MIENKVLLGLTLTTKGMLVKLLSVINATWGWILMILGLIFNFFLPVREMFHVLFLLLLVDIITGILASRKNKQAFTSDKARSSFYKLLVYLIVLCLMFIVEKAIGLNITLKVLFSVSYAIEFVSISANLLILRPNMPILRLISGALIGEISNKMNMDKDKVEEILENKNE